MRRVADPPGANNCSGTNNTPVGPRRSIARLYIPPKIIGLATHGGDLARSTAAALTGTRIRTFVVQASVALALLLLALGAAVLVALPRRAHWAARRRKASRGRLARTASNMF